MIKAINFDISLWGSNEGLIANSDSIKLYYKTKDSKYIECMNFDISKISKLKKYPDNYYVEFPEDACGIKIEVVKNNPTTDYNRGRVIIGNINLFY